MVAVASETKRRPGSYASCRVVSRRQVRCRRRPGRDFIRHDGVSRYYDPATGQFLSVDPLVALTQQAYLYAGDDPMNRTDPTGDGCIGNVENSLRCPYIRFTGNPREAAGTSPTRFVFGIYVSGLSTIWPVSPTVGTVYVNINGIVGKQPINKWTSFSVAWLRNQTDGGQNNYAETMVCDDWVGIEVYLQKGSKGPAGPSAAAQSAAYNDTKFSVVCVPFITLVF